MLHSSTKISNYRNAYSPVFEGLKAPTTAQEIILVVGKALRDKSCTKEMAASEVSELKMRVRTSEIGHSRFCPLCLMEDTKHSNNSWGTLDPL